MMTAHVNADAIVLRFDFAGNLLPQQWEILLDQLRSEHIPNLYQSGKRLHVTAEPGGSQRMKRAVAGVMHSNTSPASAILNGLSCNLGDRIETCVMLALPESLLYDRRNCVHRVPIPSA